MKKKAPLTLSSEAERGGLKHPSQRLSFRLRSPAPRYGPDTVPLFARGAPAASMGGVQLGATSREGLVIDPTDSSTVYLGTLDGAYKSTNAGGFW